MGQNEKGKILRFISCTDNRQREKQNQTKFSFAL